MVWVVEDDEPIARCLQMLLQDEGYSVDVASTLDDARALTSKPELVLLDYLLPDGNGIAYLPELAGRHPGVPVILLTALERVGKSSFPNHVTYLAKPFRNRDLIELVNSHFAAKAGA
jgi:DNA-binding response OmpR family regulator